MKSIFITISLFLASLTFAQNPVIDPNTVKNESICQYSYNCDVTPLTLKTSAISFCKKAKGIRYTYEIDFQNNGTVDLSGIGNTVNLNKNNGLIYGTHKISWSAKDACGNISKASKLFTIKDCKAPTPEVKTVSLVDTNCTVKVTADMFNKSSYDNCTSSDKLKYKIAITDDIINNMTLDNILALSDTLVYNITSINPKSILFFVIDEQNNWSFNESYIFGSCKANYENLDKFIVAKNEFNELVNNFNLKVNNFDFQSSNGFYNLPKLNEKVKVTPYKYDKDLNGVNALDIDILNNFIILGSTNFTLNKRIAGDLNSDGKISTADVLELKNSVLNNRFESLPWLFFNIKYGDPLQLKYCKSNPTNPFFVDTLCLAYQYLEYNNSTILKDTTTFLAFKLGDLDISANPSSLLKTKDRSISSTYVELDNSLFEVNETNSISIPLKSLSHSKAFQGTLHFDTQKFEYVGIDGISKDQYSLWDLQNGNITFLNVKNMNPDLEEFSIKLMSKQKCYLAEGLKFAKEPLESRVYWSENQDASLVMKFIDNQVRLFQNQPNPFTTNTSIPFILPSAQMVEFSFYDLNGRLLKSIKRNFDAGQQQLTIDANELNSNGLIYFQMITKEKTFTQNMILIKN